MCGFFCSNNFNLSNKLLDKGLNSLRERGPNEKNIIIQDNIYFGHTRLSIRDLNKVNAQQPYKEKNTNFVIVYNGELWNTEYLTNYLSCKNKNLTEVELIIRLYKLLGTDSFKLLEGMFAFTLYDPYKKCLHIVRDFFGKKPIYYYTNNEYFYTASLTSTLFSLNIPKIIKDNLLQDIVVSRHIYDGIYKDIFELRPGSFGTYSLINRSIKIQNYFKQTDLISCKDYEMRSNSSKEEIKEELSELINNAIHKRKCEEVKSGIILSGGIDSSIISYYGKKNNFNSFLHLDSVDNSELKDAQNIAKKLSVKLSHDYIDKDKFFKFLKKTIQSWEYPLVHSNGVGIYLLAKMAKENGIKVLIGGEGADELFGGYYFYKSAYLLSKLPLFNNKLNNKISKFLDFSKFNIPFNSNSISNNFSKKLNNYMNCLSIFNEFLPFNEAKVQSLMLSDLNDYLQPLLSRADRLMMANGVELRMPYLDLDLASFAINLPLKHKINLVNNKIILKEKFKKIYPDIKIKKKTGFSIDYYKEWFRDYSNEAFEIVNSKFDCKFLLDYYKNEGRYDIILRIASLAYLV
ncbi:asparagine synthase (glutamine-hydrolyzing) [Prochlorococcus marinus]|uniref:asparagine synthase (glutamine-hydrolyzing) n=1 Tax=Prochlorococcus marinus TaxID=1219 RepID=UPI001ADB4D8F|nr:asparagine synthase (glutamine-hydrolyzing) [Prochlorococcus marinus]MBO8204944.1 asparagine synthase (glutamine-hydrolyzing) [Prochlorococcus marinus CUG1415]MBW3044216.1 asparagine synthase (glutamine-hydrolyzing) [Prochlorococcus marinus str. MU1415]